jgi:hypothetical protein
LHLCGPYPVKPKKKKKQHADDASIHVPTPEDALAVLDGSVELHCLATSAKLQRAKSQGLALGSAGSYRGGGACDRHQLLSFFLGFTG